MRSAIFLLLVALSGARAQLLAQQPHAYYPQQQALAYPQQQPYYPQQQPYGLQSQQSQPPLSAFQLSQISSLAGVTPFEVVQFIQQAQHQPWMIEELSHELHMEPFQLQQLVQQANQLSQTGQDIYQIAQQATYGFSQTATQPQQPYGSQAYPQQLYGAQAYPQQPYGAQAYPQQPYGAQAYLQQPYGAQAYLQQPYGAQAPLSSFQLSQIASLSGVTPFQVAQTIQQAQYQPWALTDLSAQIGVAPLQLQQLVQQANLLSQTGQDLFQLAQQATYGALLSGAYHIEPIVQQQQPYYSQAYPYIPPAIHANVLAQPRLIAQRAISPRFAPQLVAAVHGSQPQYAVRQQQQQQQQGGLIQNVQSFLQSLGL